MKQIRSTFNPFLVLAVMFILSVLVLPVMADEHNGNVISLTDADNGRTLEIPQGSYLTISLQENPTTGANLFPKYSSGLKLVSDKYQETPLPPGWTGGGGMHTWMFKAKGTGDQNFSTINRRIWEPITGEEETFVVHLHVVKA